VGINIGDGNKIVNSNIAEKIENTNLKEKRDFMISTRGFVAFWFLFLWV